jgi:hypothetical protein
MANTDTENRARPGWRVMIYYATARAWAEAGLRDTEQQANEQAHEIRLAGYEARVERIADA